MTRIDPTLTTPPPAADEQVASRARELYAQYNQSGRAAAEPAPKSGRRRRTARRSTRANRGPADAPRPSHDEIAVRAYQLFEQSGRPPGRDVEFWLEAERQLTGVQVG